MIISTPIAAESGHWYTRDGKPAYTIIGKNGKERNTTLADARKLDLVPSVTTILAESNKAGLTNWKINQAILAALTLSRNDGESDDEYAARIRADAAEQAKKAAEQGTLIHAWVEVGMSGKPVPAGAIPFVELARKELDPLGQEWRHEKSFATPWYGGKVDLHSESYVIDIKTNEKPVADAKLWDEHLMQLAAYRHGLGLNRAACGILFINHKDMESRLVMATEKELVRGYSMFCALTNYFYEKTARRTTRMNEPVNKRYYHPQEPVPRYPLELDDRLHINLWSEYGKYKWSIAYFLFDDEGPEVRFVGDRPFDKRVNWEHFHELLKHGQLLADRRFFKNVEDEE